MPDEVVTDTVTDAPEAEVEFESGEPTTEFDDGEGAEATADATDEPSYTITVDGEEIEVPLSELRNGYSRHADYTRKTQELASEREQLASLRRLETALNDDPKGTIDALRQVFGLDIEPDPELEALDPVEREVRELRAWQAQQEEQKRQERYTAEATSAASKHGLTDVSAEDLLVFALDNKIGSLDAAARLMKAEKSTAQAAAVKTKAVERKRTAPPVEGGRTRVPQSTQPAHMSIREAWHAAVNAH